MTAPETMTMSCPSEETLAAFVDGRLNGEARRRVVEHMTSCGECRDIAVGLVAIESDLALTRNISDIVSHRRFTYRQLAAIAAAMIVTALSAAYYIWQQHTPTVVRMVVEASDALERRPFVARVAMPLEWKPPERTMRGSEKAGDDLTILIATQRINEIVRRNPSTENIRALAVANLLRHEPAEAVSALEGVLLAQTHELDVARAIAKSGDSALLVDLSAAYLTRARRSDTSRDVILASEAASRAWSLQRTASAGWNRALALEELKLYDQAIAAWQEYVEFDPASEWTTEARARMKHIAAPPRKEWEQERSRLDSPSVPGYVVAELARAFPRELANYAEELLFEWIRTPDEAPLSRLRLVGEALAKESSDKFIVDAVTHAAGSDRSSLDRLRRGVGKLLNGRKASDLTTAAAHFAEAEADLTGSPLRYRAILDRIHNAFARNDFEGAVKAGHTLVPAGYEFIVMRRGWLVGVSLVELGEPHAALVEYKRALDAAERTRDTDAAAALYALMGQNLSLLGRLADAWRYRSSGFELARQSKNSHRIGYVAAEANVAAVDEDLYEMSRVFSRIATSSSHAAPSIAIGSMMWNARRLHAIGRNDDALTEIATARSLLSTIEMPSSRERSTALIDLTEGIILVERDQDRAIDLLDHALMFFERTKGSVELAHGLEARARAHRLLGNDFSANDDVVRALAEIERQRDEIADPVLRASYVETRRVLFERMVETALEQGCVELALTLAERARTGMLPGQREVRTSEFSVTAIQRALPENARLLQYFAFHDRLLIWVVSTRGTEQRTVGVSRHTLATAVHDMNLALARHDLGAYNATAAELRDLLFHPIADLITNSRLLVVVPDTEVEAVPFSALYDRAANRYVFEEYEVVLAPSAYVSLGAKSLRTPAVPSRGLRVAMFTSAEVKGELFPTLEKLEWPETEARYLRRWVPVAEVFMDSEATPERFVAALRSYDIVHFAGHAVLHAKEPDLSAIVLTNRNGEATPLYVRELRSVRDTAVSLVILSACDTATGFGRNGGRSLAEAFLTGGVRAVIGSFSPVEDRGAADLMSALYARIARGESYAAALRNAKMELLAHHREGDMAWLAYELFGVAEG